MKTPKIFALVVALAAMLGSVAISGRAFPTQAASAQVPPNRCYNIQVLIRAQASNGAAGHIAVEYRIHNLWGNTCTIYGYPGIEFLDSQFHSLPTQVQRGHIYATNPPRPRLVRVGPYGNAYFILEYSDVPGPGSYCPQVPYLMITVPNNNLPNVTYASGGGGHLTPCRGQVNVSPVEPTTFF